MSLLEELAAAWPPAEEPSDSGYLRESLASATPVVATFLRPHGQRGLGVVVARGSSGRLMLAPVVREGAGWRRARPRDGASAALVDALATGRLLDAGFQVHRLGGVARLRGERAIGVDQTNESVVVGSGVVVKWLAEPALRSASVPDLQAHLSAIGYRGVPRPLGSLVWTDAQGMQATLAFLTEWLADARDGWDWCVQELLAHLEHEPSMCQLECDAVTFPAALGRLMAGLHIALATPSDVMPVPSSSVGRATVSAWQAAAMGALEMALAVLPDDLAPMLAARADTLRAMIRGMDDVADTLVQRIHGDLHVGQVLSSVQGLAVIDLDDDISIDPTERGQPLPVARDVAQMTCSLDHVGRIADRRTGGGSSAAIEDWITGAQDALMVAYRETLATAGQSRLLDDRLLRPLTAERICRELVYAARVLPRWLYAPMGTLMQEIPAVDGPERT